MVPTDENLDFLCCKKTSNELFLRYCDYRASESQGLVDHYNKMHLDIIYKEIDHHQRAMAMEANHR